MTSSISSVEVAEIAGVNSSLKEPSPTIENNSNSNSNSNRYHSNNSNHNSNYSNNDSNNEYNSNSNNSKNSNNREIDNSSNSNDAYMIHDSCIVVTDDFSYHKRKMTSAEIVDDQLEDIPTFSGAYINDTKRHKILETGPKFSPVDDDNSFLFLISSVPGKNESESSNSNSVAISGGANNSSNRGDNNKDLDLKCPRCFREFASYSIVSYHVKFKLCQKVTPRCDHCLEQFSTKHRLNKHLQAKLCQKSSSSNVPPNAFPRCPHCLKDFTSNSGLNLHVELKVCQKYGETIRGVSGLN